MTKKYKFIDLFSGIGAFRIGLEKQGFQCVWSSDNNKNCQETYQANFGDRPFGDITKIKPKEIPDFDLITAGFPCQPFSISGRHKGFNDTRGTLFFDICRIIKEKKPKVIILENVKHFINHDKKKTIKKIINSLEELNYNVTYKILNASDFGLPQNRERIFIIASKKGYFDFSLIKTKKSKTLKFFLDKDKKFSFLKKNEYTLLEKKFIKKQDSGLIFVGYRNKNMFKRGVRPNSEHLNRTHRQPNRIYSSEGYHPTLPSQESAGRFFILDENKKVRKLTVDECYRIMGFPKKFIKSPKSGEQYKQIGNSIAINVIEEIVKEIVNQKLLDEKFKHKYDTLENFIFQDHV